jgi:hypothetical protein
MSHESTFGCPACFQGDAKAVLASGALERVHRVYDESHYSVNIERCRHCGQPAVRVFTEFVDWTGGEDSMYVSIIPITPAEADLLVAQGENVDDKAIEAMSRGRPYLQSDWPTGKEKRTEWREGPVWIMRGH